MGDVEGVAPSASAARPAAVASSTPFGERSTSVQPVKRFSRFQVLSPWRSRTSVYIGSRPSVASAHYRVGASAHVREPAADRRTLPAARPSAARGHARQQARHLHRPLPRRWCCCATSTWASARRRTSIFAYGAGSFVSILAGGVLTDRLGRRRTLLAEPVRLGRARGADGPRCPRRGSSSPLLVAFGFIADLYRPAASAMIGDLLPSSERASGFAGLRMAVNLGWASGTALGGLLADWDWRLLFLGDGLTTLAYGVLVYFTIPETRPAPARGPVALAVPAAPDDARRPSTRRRGSSPFGDLVFLAVGVDHLPLHADLLLAPRRCCRSRSRSRRATRRSVYGLLAAVNGTLDRALRAVARRAAQALPPAAARRARLRARRRRLRHGRPRDALGAGSCSPSWSSRSARSCRRRSRWRSSRTGRRPRRAAAT